MNTTGLLTSVRGSVHQDVASGRLPDSLLVAWANEDLPTLFARISDEVPSYFEKTTASITVAEGTTVVDLTAAPVSLTDFRKTRAVELLSGNAWLPLRTAESLASTVTGTGTGLAGTYRVKYVRKPAPLVLVDNTVVDLPPGLERSLVETLASRVRVRFNESGKVHLDAAEACYGLVRGSLLRTLAPQRIMRMANMLQWPRWRPNGANSIELVAGA